MAIVGGIFGFIIGIILTILIAIFGFFGFVVSDSTSIGSDVSTGGVSAYTPALVDTAWVESEQATNPNLIMVDVATETDYAAGHIPGAVRIDPADIDIAGTEDADWQENIETVLGGAGISVDATVVIYDRGDLRAAGLWWALTRLSHPAVAVLDGGLPAWEAAQLPTELGLPADAPVTTLYFGWTNDALVVTTEEVEAAIDDPDVVIIDVRSESDYAAGHIPGAINIPATANFDEDGQYLPMVELNALYETAGVTFDKQVILYCSSGILSSNTALALNSLGFWSVQIYAGSWPEWSSDPTRPVES